MGTNIASAAIDSIMMRVVPSIRFHTCFYNMFEVVTCVWMSRPSSSFQILNPITYRIVDQFCVRLVIISYRNSDDLVDRVDTTLWTGIIKQALEILLDLFGLCRVKRKVLDQKCIILCVARDSSHLLERLRWVFAKMAIPRSTSR